MALLLGTDPSRTKLIDLLKKNTSGIVLSAFFSDSADKWLSEFELDASTFVVRGQYLDFTSGVTSLKALKSLLHKGHIVKLKLNLHAKLFWFGNEMLVGSSNLTGNGFNLIENGGNVELNSVVPATSENVAVVNNIISSSFELTNELIDKMEILLNRESSLSPKRNFDWPSDLFEEKNASLYVSDFPLLDFNESSEHDLNLWGDMARKQLAGEIVQAQESLEKTKIFGWLISKLEQEGERGLSFGAFSSLLHNELKADPALFRWEVKELQRNLYSFLEKIPCAINLSVPGARSQVLKLQ